MTLSPILSPPGYLLISCTLKGAYLRGEKVSRCPKEYVKLNFTKLFIVHFLQELFHSFTLTIISSFHHPYLPLALVKFKRGSLQRGLIFAVKRVANLHEN